MRANIENLKKVIQKATLNNLIDSVQLNFENGKIKTRMINEDGDAIIFLNVEDNVFGINDEMTLNFQDPAQNLLPFLNIIEDDLADIDMLPERMVVKSGRQKANVHFCNEATVRTFSSEPREMDYFLELCLDETFIEAFKKIKKVGTKFGNVYFNVDGNIFSIETTDKTNRFANGLKFDLTEIENDNLTMCFSFKNFVNLMTVINGEADSFTMKFAYIAEQERGALIAVSVDNSQQYYLMSRAVDR